MIKVRVFLMSAPFYSESDNSYSFVPAIVGSVWRRLQANRFINAEQGLYIFLPIVDYVLNAATDYDPSQHILQGELFNDEP